MISVLITNFYVFCFDDELLCFDDEFKQNVKIYIVHEELKFENICYPYFLIWKHLLSLTF